MKILGVAVLILLTLCIAAACSAGSSKVVGSYEFQGSSMEPTFSNGDAATFIGLGETPPQRGDIVLFLAPDQTPGAPERLFMKRVIALPNETVAVRDGNVYINDQPLDEPYIAEPPTYTFEPARVPQGEYFVLGDNRNNSSDSHSWGMLPIANIKGRLDLK